MKNVTLRQLRIFASAARQQSFGKAAEELHLTPPAVSMQMRDMEEQVGLPLFDRTGRNVTLTVTGEYLLVYVRKVLATLKDADDAIAKFRGLEAGRLTIGMVSTATYFLPRLLAQFRTEHTEVDVRLAVGNREQLVAMMQAGDVDLAVMGRPPREFATRAEPFAVQPHVIVTDPQHPLLVVEHVPAAMLANYGFIVRERGSGTRAAAEQFFEEHRVTPQVVMEMSSNETIKQAVIAGMGISFLSLHTIGLELKSGLIAVPDVEGMPVVRRWYIVNTLAKTLSPAAEAFRYFILEEAEAFLAHEFGSLDVSALTETPAADRAT